MIKKLINIENPYYEVVFCGDINDGDYVYEYNEYSKEDFENNQTLLDILSFLYESVLNIPHKLEEIDDLIWNNEIYLSEYISLPYDTQIPQIAHTLEEMNIYYYEGTNRYKIFLEDKN